jgi:putative endonuclease
MLKGSMRSFWVYILASSPRGTLYVGMTNDLIRRVYQHREGPSKDSPKGMASKMPVYYEDTTAIAAIQREKNIRHWPRKWKIDLICSMNSDWRDLWQDIVR